MRERGINAMVFERAENYAPVWRVAYDRLRLNTSRSRSSLPGQPIPRRVGRWPTRDDFVAYLDQFVDYHDIDLRLGVSVDDIEPAEGGWTLRTSAGTLQATQVVVATGVNAAPSWPPWASGGVFTGTVLHSTQYRTGSAFARQRVVVVGAGNSGSDIVVDLLDHHAEVALAIRTPPHIVPRQRLGIPADLIGVAMRRLPAAVGDRVVALASRATFGDLSRYGLATPPEGAITRHRRDSTEPVIDNGLVNAIRSGRVTLLPAIHALTPSGVLLSNGTTHDADVVIAATGFRTSLAQITAKLDILDDRGLPVIHGPTVDPRYPGLRFSASPARSAATCGSCATTHAASPRPCNATWPPKVHRADPGSARPSQRGGSTDDRRHRGPEAGGTSW